GPAAPAAEAKTVGVLSAAGRTRPHGPTLGQPLRNAEWPARCGRPNAVPRTATEREGEFQEIARVPNKPTMPVTKRVSTCDASLYLGCSAGLGLVRQSRAIDQRRA